MSGSGGVSIARNHRGENRFYNPPPIRQRQLEQQQQQQRQLEQQQQQQKKQALPLPSPPVVVDSVVVASSVEADKSRTATTTTTTATAEDCASLFCSVSALGGSVGDGTNLDRFLEYTTPSVSSQYFSKVAEKDFFFF